jgi:hypothetical protein
LATGAPEVGVPPKFLHPFADILDLVEDAPKHGQVPQRLEVGYQLGPVPGPGIVQGLLQELPVEGLGEVPGPAARVPVLPELVGGKPSLLPPGHPLQGPLPLRAPHLLPLQALGGQEGVGPHPSSRLGAQEQLGHGKPGLLPGPPRLGGKQDTVALVELGHRPQDLLLRGGGHQVVAVALGHRLPDGGHHRSLAPVEAVVGGVGHAQRVARGGGGVKGEKSLSCKRWGGIKVSLLRFP